MASIPTLEHPVTVIFKCEVSDLEHAEPGTGSPPEPREKPIEDDAAQGWRRDTPPIVEELENG